MTAAGNPLSLKRFAAPLSHLALNREIVECENIVAPSDRGYRFLAGITAAGRLFALVRRELEPPVELHASLCTKVSSISAIRRSIRLSVALN